MFSFLKRLLKTESQVVKDLKLENKKLQDKLAEKQEHINKTNAYWKKKVSLLSKNNGAG